MLKPRGGSCELDKKPINMKKNMVYRIQDPIFNYLGEPNIIKDYNEKNGKVSIDTDKTAIKHEFRNGYIKGIPPELRTAFNSLIDMVKKTEDPNEKISLLNNKISELEQSGDPQAVTFLGYLKAEVAHIMHSFNIQPRYYSVYEGKLP